LFYKQENKSFLHKVSLRWYWRNERFFFTWTRPIILCLVCCKTSKWWEISFKNMSFLECFQGPLHSWKGHIFTIIDVLEYRHCSLWKLVLLLNISKKFYLTFNLQWSTLTLPCKINQGHVIRTEYKCKMEPILACWYGTKYINNFWDLINRYFRCYKWLLMAILKKVNTSFLWE
jgi:hypothetical protein